MRTLFDEANEKRRRVYAPLADRMRPRTLDEIVGQEELTAPESPLRVVIEAGQVPSMIFWGPPGSGKTTFAKCIAASAKVEFVELSAVTSGTADVRSVIREAEARLDVHGKRTILFIDEIHRFNKSQQDAFLPWVENGTIILVGATTENPSFEVNGALLSRCRVFVLRALSPQEMRAIIQRALTDGERGLGKLAPRVPEDVIDALVNVADGDARVALNILEMVGSIAHKREVTREDVAAALQRTHLRYDKQGEEHYNVISALHKSLRGSDADASVYWLGRMLEAGEDPLYVARRLVRFASEDVGLADAQALPLAVAGFEAAHNVGMPECGVILAHVTAYLARARKSNAVYAAYQAVQQDIRAMPNEPVPLHLRNAPTSLMKQLGYGKGYIYNPDVQGPVDQTYLPERLKGKTYLPPV